MILFIEDHRMDFGVESICKVLPVAPSSYYANLAIRRDPGLASNRTHQDVTDSVEIRRIHDESRSRYPLSTANDWLMPALIHPWELWEIPMTMPSPKASLACSKLKSQVTGPMEINGPA